jgi:predicted DNA-binding transcriptional regulator AlpA
MAHASEREAYTTRDAAHYTGMSESYFRQSRVTGNPDAPPYLKLGRAVRYLRKDLEAWLDARRRRSTSEAA